MVRVGLLVLLAMPLGAAPAIADEPFRFPEGKHGKGELKYLNGVPVLAVAGKPEEIGEQVGKLALKPAAGAVRVFKNYLKQQKLDLLWPLLVRLGRQQFDRFPPEYRRELEAMAKASGVDLELLIVANALDELRTLAGCSCLVVGPGRSKTGGILMGRNWDFPPLAGLHQYSLVTVCRPADKRAFVSVGFPGFLGSGNAMNADGLAFAANEVRTSADRSPRLDLKGTPSAVLARRLLEDCGTLAEAEKLLRGSRRSGMVILVACDRDSGAVFEITTKSFHVRRGEDGLCAGTNHFVCPELAVQKGCHRLDALSAAAKLPKLAVADVARKMDEANQGAWTVHTMVFEPRARRLHVAFGDGKSSATARRLRALDLGPLLGS